MKPILFNTEMVRAISDGRKTVTRRVIDVPQGFRFLGWNMDSGDDIQYGDCAFISDNGMTQIVRKPKYKINDVLYVRETWSTHYIVESNGELVYCYKADGLDLKAECLPGENNRWYPSIHMPKEAARLFLRVTNVRVERLQDITEEQAMLEGVPCFDHYPINEKYCPTCKGFGLIGGYDNNTLGFVEKECEDCNTGIKRFSHLWNSTIKKSNMDKYRWEVNPYVFVYEFEMISKEAAMETENEMC